MRILCSLCKNLFLLALVFLLLTGASCRSSGTKKKQRRIVQGHSVSNVADGSPDLEQPEDPGRWRKFRTHRFDESLSEQQRKQIAELESIGYAGGLRPPPSRSGVTVYSKDMAYEGLNFFVSGHAPEAMLLDMDGRVLHRWHYEFRKIWPDYPLADDPKSPKGLEDPEHAQFWRRAHLFENGDILAIFEGLGIIKLDKDSKLLWESAVRAHHDLQVMPDGDIYVLTREAHMLENIRKDDPVLEDFISVLDRDGKEIRRVSLLKAFENSAFRRIIENRNWWSGDIFHTNTLEVLSGKLGKRMPEFSEGNVLTCMLYLNTVAVVDLQRESVVWVYEESSRGTHKHDPQILENGNMLLFLNDAGPEQSGVIEFDPLTREVLWEYLGSSTKPFYSQTCGTAQRLPNGNTLIVESDNGRAFEVTKAKEIVWEFISPYRAGQEKEFIATALQMTRLPQDFSRSWLKEITE